MERYKNISSKPNVESFEIGEDYIIVVFRSGRERWHLYTYASAGVDNVERMKELDRAGVGLGKMLATKPYYGYARKW